MKRFLSFMLLSCLMAVMALADEPFRNHRYDSWKVITPQPGSIIFVGNSITDMHNWTEAFGNPTNGTTQSPLIINRGNSGALSGEMLRNVWSWVSSQPSKVFIKIGTNDLGSDMHEEVILENISKTIQIIRTESPETEIYLQSILPARDQKYKTLATIQATNVLLKKLADETEHCTYIDLYSKLGGIRSGMPYSIDNLHMMAYGYYIWCNAIAPYVGFDCVYPTNTNDIQTYATMWNSHGMRASYHSVQPVTSNDVLIIGDEMVKNGEWNELLRNVNVKNRGTGWGYGGSIADASNITDATFANKDNGITRQDPKQILLYTGTGDINGQTDLQTVQANYQQLIDKIRGYAPTSPIVLVSLMPTSNANARITDFNSWLQTTAETTANCTYLDIYTTLANANGTAKSEYFNGNYLWSKGYVAVANIFASVIEGCNPITTEEADAAYHNFEKTSTLGSITAGTGLGQYPQSAIDALKNASDADFSTQLDLLKQSINMPDETNTTDKWFRLSTPNRENAYIYSAGSTLNGDMLYPNTLGYRWQFVKRSDNTWDIVNGNGCYIVPNSTYNSAIQVSKSSPTKGWELSYSNALGTYIIQNTSLQCQLNQTAVSGRPVYNWSNGGKCNDRNDTGCQILIEDVTDLEVPPTPTAEPKTYVIDKTTGSLYHSNGTANASYNCRWVSTETPQLVFNCGTVNNMSWASNTVQLMTGTSGSATYNIAAPDGYVIDKYSFETQNNNHTTALTLTLDGTTYSTSQDALPFSKSDVNKKTVTFNLAGANGKGVLMNNFTVTIKPEGEVESPKGPIISTEDDVHWYYITSASTIAYCAGKVINYDSSTDRLRFDDKKFQSDRIWSFWEKDGKLTIKNYDGIYFGTAPSGTGGSTQFGKSDTPNYIYTIQSAFDAFTIKDTGIELHAQQAGTCIVRWAAAAGNASLWQFDEVEITPENASATLSSTTVQQAKVTTGIGNHDAPIVRSTLHVSGLGGSLNLNKVTVYVNNKSNTQNIKVYVANNAQELFVDADGKMPWRQPNAVLFGEVKTADQSLATIEIEGNATLLPGDNYLWLAYDISDEAAEGSYVKGSFVSYTVGEETINEQATRDAQCPNKVNIFLSEGSVLMPMDNGSLYYRIPSITCVEKDGKTRLVTLTDDRKNHNADLPSHCYVVAQYSDDLGRTWSSPLTVAGTESTGGDYGHGDASLVTNRNNGNITGIMVSSGTYGHGYFAGTAEQPARWRTITSTDGGETWTAPHDYTDDLYGANAPSHQNWLSGFSGSGAALQLRDGTLVSSFVNRELNNGQETRNFYLFMSEDNGQTWYVSGNSGTTGADEPKTLERNNGDLAISVRSSGFNFHNVTSDRGQTWKYAPQTRFKSGISGNACDGEYMVWCSSLDGNQVADGIGNIAFQTAPNSGNRENVSIALSLDEGETFLTPKTICPTGSAYSATTVLPDGTLGVYYEENGIYGSYTMRFVRFSLDWASDGRYKFTEDNPFRPIGYTPTDIDSPATTNAHNIATKCIQGNRVIIVLDGHKYTTTGVRIND